MAISDLERMLPWARELGLAATAERIDRALRRLGTGSFRIAVAGDRGAGKSLLVNSLLGAGLLPCAEQPCTEVPIRIVGGGEPPRQLLVFRLADGETEGPPPLAVDELTPFVTRLDPLFAQQAATLLEARVEHPVPLCRDGVELWDLPGLEPGGAVAGDAHVHLVVIAADRPFLPPSIELAVRLLDDASSWAMVVTRVDRATAEQAREAVLRFRGAIEEALAARRSAGAPDGAEARARLALVEAFAVSSRQALRARRTGDAVLAAASGLGRLEAWLLHQRFRRGEIRDAIAPSCLRAAGREILARLEADAAERVHRRAGLEELARTGHRLMAGLRSLGRDEARRIGEAARETGAALRERTRDWPERATRRLLQEIAAVPAEEDAPDERLACRLDDAFAEASRPLAEELQREIDRRRLEALDRLHGFAAACDQLAARLAERTAGAGMEPGPEGSLVERLAGLWAEQRDLVARCAGNGPLPDPGAAFAAGRLAACLEPPETRLPEGWRGLLPEERAVALARLCEETFRGAVPRLERAAAASFARLEREIESGLERTRKRIERLGGAGAPVGALEPEILRRSVEEILKTAGAGGGE